MTTHLPDASRARTPEHTARTSAPASSTAGAPPPTDPHGSAPATSTAGAPPPTDPHGSAPATSTAEAPAALAALGYGTGPWPALLLDVAPAVDPATGHGRVVRADRGAVTVLTAAGTRRAVPAPGEPPPVTGDWVAVDDDDRIAGTAPRRTAVIRPSTTGGGDGGADQVLAANADLVGVVAAADADLRPRRVERGLVLAYESGATPVLLLTKADASDHLDRVLRDAARSAPGVDVLPVSSVTGEGVADVQALLAPDRTIALLGASGAGKSSLANALAGEHVLATQDVRRSDGKGRHTTTHRELVPLPTGGAVLDTPGLRSISLGAVSDAVDQAFPDVEELAAGCRFADCRHAAEPGCAVLAALDDGRLHPDRYEGWSRIQRAAAAAALRADPVRARRANRRFGAMAREAQRFKGGPPR